jgi:hypothetical protein
VIPGGLSRWFEVRVPEGEGVDYFVSWEIEVEAGNPIEAARLARAAQTQPGTMATVFKVSGEDAGEAVLVDLTSIAEASQT